MQYIPVGFQLTPEERNKMAAELSGLDQRQAELAEAAEAENIQEPARDDVE